jgi:hypothetical protein
MDPAGAEVLAGPLGAEVDDDEIGIEIEEEDELDRGNDVISQLFHLVGIIPERLIFLHGGTI